MKTCKTCGRHIPGWQNDCLPSRPFAHTEQGTDQSTELALLRATIERVREVVSRPAPVTGEAITIFDAFDAGYYAMAQKVQVALDGEEKALHED